MPNKKPLPYGPSISAAPEKSMLRKGLDFVSPVPLDKAYYMNNPKDKIFMDLISDAAMSGLGGAVIGKGLSRAKKFLGGGTKPVSQTMSDMGYGKASEEGKDFWSKIMDTRNRWDEIRGRR